MFNRRFCFDCVLFIFIILPRGFCWDNDELELFDLVEEINENFYTVLGVETSASSAEIKRAYRKLSLQLHPDKNKEDDAEVKFRQLVSVYEVLKDDSKRAKYNEILENGLPDWRQPVYYYRRVRKLGLLEMTFLLSIILTIGHFLIVWSVYFERRFEKENKIFRSRKKKSHKNKQPDVDDLLQAELQGIEKPKLVDLLPCLIVKLAACAVINAPSFAQLTLEKLKFALEQRQNENDDDDDDDKSAVNEKNPRPKRKKLNLLPAYDDLDIKSEEEKQSKTDKCFYSSDEGTSVKLMSANEWTDSETELLAKAVARFPGGTTERWEKIAQMVGKTVKEVTSKSKELKTNCVKSVDPSQQGITLLKLINCPSKKIILPNSTSEREDDVLNEQPNVRRLVDGSVVRQRVNVVPKSLERTLMISTTNVPKPESNNDVDNALMWTQQQQRLLEAALIQYPKGTTDRWDRVAESIPGKSKDDCVKRFKHLADIVKQKQMKSSNEERSHT